MPKYPDLTAESDSNFRPRAVVQFHPGRTPRYCRPRKLVLPNDRLVGGPSGSMPGADVLSNKVGFLGLIECRVSRFATRKSGNRCFRSG